MNVTSIPPELNRSLPTMVLISNIAYPIELVCYTVILALVPAYLLLSRGGYRFHPILRFQIFVLVVELYLVAVTRGTGVVFRLYEAAAVVISAELQLARDIITNLNFCCVGYVHITAIVIPFERLLAAKRLTDYEKSYHHPIYRVAFLLYVLFWTIFFYLLYFHGGLYNFWANEILLVVVNVISIVVYLIGYIVMDISRKISIRNQRENMNIYRELSTSFQYKENLLVVSIIRPVFAYLFFSRLFQFVSQAAMYAWRLNLNPVLFKLATCGYNVSLAFGFMLVPVMLLKSHPNLLKMTRRTPVVTASDGATYFRELNNMWA